MPRAYEDLTWAMDHALQHIQDQQKIIDDLENTYPESLINEIIDLRVKFTNENEWTATRKVWADHFNFDEEEIKGLEKIKTNITASLSILVDKKLDLFSSKVNNSK